MHWDTITKVRLDHGLLLYSAMCAHTYKARNHKHKRFLPSHFGLRPERFSHSCHVRCWLHARESQSVEKFERTMVCRVKQSTSLLKYCRFGCRRPPMKQHSTSNHRYPSIVVLNFNLSQLRSALRLPAPQCNYCGWNMPHEAARAKADAANELTLTAKDFKHQCIRSFIKD